MTESAGPWHGARRRSLSLPETWPGGGLVAVWPVVNVETFLPEQGGPAIQPHLTNSPEIANRGWRDYGNNAGVHRLARLLGSLHLPASAAVNANVCSLYPQVLERVLSAGWEVMGHGWNNSGGHAGLDEQAETASVQGVIETLLRATGARPRGWLTPGFAVTARTPSALAACGLHYTADATDDDVAYALDTDAGPLAVLPYSMETNDISLCVVGHYTADEYGAALEQHVAQLCRETQAGRPVIVALGLHTFVAGQPARAAVVEQVLRRMQQLPQVWFASGAMICDALSLPGAGP